jgi:hypothetical protein
MAKRDFLFALTEREREPERLLGETGGEEGESGSPGGEEEGGDEGGQDDSGEEHALADGEAVGDCDGGGVGSWRGRSRRDS